MDTLEALLTRASAIELTEPGPDREILEVALRAAAAAPDHGRLRPWRFIVIGGDERHGFGELLAAALAHRAPGASERELQKERERALRAPMIIVVVAKTQPDHPKIPEIEQVLSAGAAAQNLLLAFHAYGFGCMWKTGKPAYDPAVKEALGLDLCDHIVGFLYIGTQRRGSPPRQRANGDDLVTFWSSPK